MKVTNSAEGLSYYTWPLIVTGMLLSVICAGVYTIIIASRTPAQLVESSPYEKGLEFEKTIQHRKRAIQEKLILDYEINHSASGKSKLKVNLDPVKMSSAGEPDSIQIKFIRPSNKELDFSTSLTRLNETTYDGAIPEIRNGLWFIEIEVTSKDGQRSSYRYEAMISKD